jgi:hypothetical protein
MLRGRWANVLGTILKELYNLIERLVKQYWPRRTLKNFSTPASTVQAVVAGYEQDATLEAALKRMVRLEKALKRNDGRRFFLKAYRQMTGSLQKTLEKQPEKPFFNDPQWVDAFGAAFARLYFKRLKAYYEGGQTAQPVCWRQAFLVAALSPAPRFRAMLAGINGHLLYDIPIALAETGVFELPGMAERQEDFLRINKLIWRNINPIKRMVLNSRREQLLSLLSEGLGGMVNLVVFNGFVLQREYAWRSGMELAQEAIDPAELDRRACEHLTHLNTWSGVVGIVLEILVYYCFKGKTAAENIQSEAAVSSAPEAEKSAPALV